MIRRRALVELNASGGKASQAMTLLLAPIVCRDPLLVVHGPHARSSGTTPAHNESTIPPGVPPIMAAVTSGKTLLEQLEERGMWPSKSARWCPSCTKRGRIERELRRDLKTRPATGGA